MPFVRHLVSSFLLSGGVGATAFATDGGGGFGADSVGLVNLADCLRSLSAKASIPYSLERLASPCNMDIAEICPLKYCGASYVGALAFRWLGRSRLRQGSSICTAFLLSHLRVRIYHRDNRNAGGSLQLFLLQSALILMADQQ